MRTRNTKECVQLKCSITNMEVQSYIELERRTAELNETLREQKMVNSKQSADIKMLKQSCDELNMLIETDRKQYQNSYEIQLMRANEATMQSEQAAQLIRNAAETSEGESERR